MSTKNPRQKLAEAFQTARDNCKLSLENLQAIAEAKCLPEMGQLSTLKSAMSDKQIDIARERSEESSDEHILSAHSSVTTEDLEDLGRKAEAVKWISGHGISSSQAKAIKDINHSGQAFGRDKHPVLAGQFTEVEFHKHSKALLGHDPQDLYDLRSLPQDLTQQEIQDIADGKTGSSKLTDKPRDLIIRLCVDTPEHVRLHPKDVQYFRNMRSEVTLKHIKALDYFVKSTFKDENNVNLPENDLLACLQKDSTKDLSAYNFDETSAALVLSGGVYANRTPAEIKIFHHLAAGWSPDVTALTQTHLEKVKAVVENRKIAAADLTAIDRFKTATATSDDVMTVAELVNSGIATVDIKNVLVAAVASQPLTVTTGTVTRTIDAAKVTATLIAAKDSFDGKDTTLKLIGSKVFVDAVSELRAGNYTDDKIVAATGIQSSVATNTEELKSVIQGFRSIPHVDDTDVQVANLRAANNPIFESDYSVRTLVEIRKFDAASPDDVERKVWKAISDELTNKSNATTASVKAAASAVAGEVRSKVLDAINKPYDSTEALRSAALDAYKKSDNCVVYKAVSKLQGLIKSPNDLIAPEVFNGGIKDLAVSHITGLSGNCSIKPGMAYLAIKGFGRDDGEKTNCDLSSSFSDLFTARFDVEKEMPEADFPNLLHYLNDRYNQKGVVTEADVNKALGQCPHHLKLAEFLAQGGLDSWKNSTSAYLSSAADNVKANAQGFITNGGKVSEWFKSVWSGLEDATQVKNKVDAADYAGLDFLSIEMADSAINGAVGAYCKGYGVNIFKNPCNDFSKFEPKNLDKNGTEIVCPKSDNTIAEILGGAVVGAFAYKLISDKVTGVVTNLGNTIATKAQLNSDNFAVRGITSDNTSIAANQGLTFDSNGVARFSIPKIASKVVDSCALTKAVLAVSLPITFTGRICLTGNFDDELYANFKDSNGKILKEFKSDGFDTLRSSCDNYVSQAVNWCWNKGEYDFTGTFELDVRTGGTGFLDGAFDLIDAVTVFSEHIIK